MTAAVMPERRAETSPTPARDTAVARAAAGSGHAERGNEIGSASRTGGQGGFVAGAPAERWWPPAAPDARDPRWRGLPLAHRAAAWQLRRQTAALASHWRRPVGGTAETCGLPADAECNVSHWSRPVAGTAEAAAGDKPDAAAAVAADNRDPAVAAAADKPDAARGVVADDAGAVRDACRRAAVRGDAAAHAQARLQALRWLAAACERLLGRRPAPEVLAAAWHLGEAHAVALPDTAARRLALALAAVTAAWSGRPCHVVCAGEEQVPLLVQALRPLLEHCGVTLACATTQTPPAELVAAYRADVLVATARRLVTDHCRDLRLRRGVDSRLRWDLRQAVTGPSRLLTRGLHTALLDDLDAVLADEAMTPVLMAVADEGSAFPQAVRSAGACAAALSPGIDYRLTGDGGAALTPAGMSRLADWLPALPPLWRAAARAQELVAQALFVRHALKRDRDYVLRADGVDFIAEGLLERLPAGVGWFGLSQAVEAAEGREPAAPARTVERTSVQTFFNRYHHLAGAAPCLDGLEAELWRRHGLPAWHGDRAAPTPQRRLWLARSADPQALLEAEARTALAGGHAVLVVGRTAAQAGAWAAWQGDPCVAVAVWPAGVPAALARLSRLPAGVSGITVLLQEPLDSARAEAALAHRAAGATGVTAAAATVVRAASGNARVLREHLRPLAAVLGGLRPALPPLMRAAQALAERGAQRRRHALAQREAQIGRQLSFSGTSRHAAAAAPPSSPHVRPTSVQEPSDAPASQPGT